MDKETIKQKILTLFREKEIMKDLTEEQDFFDLGVSSLTVVELQIVVEKELKLSIPTSKLMASPTVSEWVELYATAAEKAQEDVAVTAS